MKRGDVLLHHWVSEGEVLEKFRPGKKRGCAGHTFQKDSQKVRPGRNKKPRRGGKGVLQRGWVT